MSTDDGIIDQAKKVLTDQEHSIGEKAPGTPFLFVAMSYLAVLALACGTIAAIMWAIG